MGFEPTTFASTTADKDQGKGPKLCPKLDRIVAFVDEGGGGILLAVVGGFKSD